MARPRGYRLSREAFDDILLLTQKSRSEGAELSGISMQMISDLYGKRRTGASIKTARLLADAFGVKAGTLFPEIAGFGAPEPEDDPS